MLTRLQNRMKPFQLSIGMVVSPLLQLPCFSSYHNYISICAHLGLLVLPSIAVAAITWISILSQAYLHPCTFRPPSFTFDASSLQLPSMLIFVYFPLFSHCSWWFGASVFFSSARSSVPLIFRIAFSSSYRLGFAMFGFKLSGLAVCTVLGMNLSNC